ncbi:dihydropteroate synthase, partial [Micromonospora sp. NPDC051296]
KSYLGLLLAGPDGTPRPTAGREAATVATSLLAVAAGAWGVRVHDVGATVDALAVWQATGRPRLPRAPGTPLPEAAAPDAVTAGAARGPAGPTAGGPADRGALR